MIKNILKLSIVTVLLLGTTVVGMDTGVPALVDGNAMRSSSVPVPLPTAEVQGRSDVPTGDTADGINRSAPLNMGRGMPLRGQMPFGLSAPFSGADDGTGSSVRITSLETLLGGIFGDPDLLARLRDGGCLECFDGFSGIPAIPFERQRTLVGAKLAAIDVELAASDVELATSTERKRQITVEIDHLTAEIEALDATDINANIARLTAELEAQDKDAGLMASLEELKVKLLDTQAKTARYTRLQADLMQIQEMIDLMLERRIVTDRVRQGWKAEEAAEEASKEAAKLARAAEKARREAKEAAREAGLKQIFLTQITGDPESMELIIGTPSSTGENRADVLRLLQVGNFAGLKITHVNLGLNLAPVTVPSSVTVSDDTVTGVSTGDVAAVSSGEKGEDDHNHDGDDAEGDDD